jgi:signal transduction histidine kinase
MGLNNKKTPVLKIANNSNNHQNVEKEKLAAELIIANKELIYQNEEKEKRAAELAVAKKEISLQNKEKKKRAGELIVANKEIVHQNEEKEKRAAEFIIANKELGLKNEEKEKCAAELIIAFSELRKSAGNEKEYRKGLEKMMYMTSHQLRIPIANILGILNHLDSTTISPEEIKEMNVFLKQFAKSLDHLTRDLGTFIYNQGVKLNNDNQE